jgi:shikimate dehydrogenase
MNGIHRIAELRDWKKVSRELSPPVRLGVVGNPVAHSLSPAMQNAALEASGVDVRYGLFEIAPNELEEALELFSEHNFVGVNLTAPHKLAALPLVNELEDRARQVGAINTIVFRDRTSFGANTDAPGFVHAIRDAFSVDLRDLRVMILGAGGGAGRALSWQCAWEQCERLVLVNRSFDRAQELMQQLAGYFSGPRVFGPAARLEAIPWKEGELRREVDRIDLVVNATSLGMKQSDPLPLSRSLLAPHLMIYDLIYRATPTPLLTAAAEAGARGADGRTMLLHQGALSFELWFDRPAPLAVMRHALESPT